MSVRLPIFAPWLAMRPRSYPARQSIKLRLITFCPGNCNANRFPFVEYANIRRGSARSGAIQYGWQLLESVAGASIVYRRLMSFSGEWLERNRTRSRRSEQTPGRLLAFFARPTPSFFSLTGLPRLDGRRLLVASLCPYPRLSHTAPGYCPLRRFPAVSWRRLAKERTVTSLKEAARG